MRMVIGGRTCWIAREASDLMALVPKVARARPAELGLVLEWYDSDWRLRCSMILDLGDFWVLVGDPRKRRGR